METQDFQEIIWDKGRELYRTMPWREDTRPYFVLVSEIMLQQTQVDRVVPKFLEFTKKFYSIESLARADLADVLKLWSGLGYNRRAKFLHEAAKMVVADFKGTFPDTLEELIKLPGVGVNTAGAILAYSFNKPSIFIETNVRTVYFYHFFNNAEAVDDKDIRLALESSIDKEHPREWYWALMDYGTYLKKNGASLNDKSKHYKKQTPLKGSLREVRGQILKQLALHDLKLEDLKNNVVFDDRFITAFEGLKKDGLITETAGKVHLTR